MSYLIAVTFNNEEEAGQVRETLRKEERSGYINLNDSAVVVRDSDGKLHVKDELDRGVKTGAVGGSLLGLLIGGIIFPGVGLILGGLVGAGFGALLHRGIDKKFIKEVEESMEPGSSAIFFISRDDRPDAAIASLRPYKGKIYSTTLSEEDEEA
jgi:uncharacterized membrane protein